MPETRASQSWQSFSWFYLTKPDTDGEPVFRACKIDFCEMQILLMPIPQKTQDAPLIGDSGLGTLNRTGSSVKLAAVSGLRHARGAFLTSGRAPPAHNQRIDTHVENTRTLFCSHLPAIVQAHAFANQHRLPVRADDHATYYLGGRAETAIIQTDTDFGSAHFIIDDHEVENMRACVFTVDSALRPLQPTGITSLEQGQREMRDPLIKSCVVCVTDADIKR